MTRCPAIARRSCRPRYSVPRRHTSVLPHATASSSHAGVTSRSRTCVGLTATWPGSATVVRLRHHAEVRAGVARRHNLVDYEHVKGQVQCLRDLGRDREAAVGHARDHGVAPGVLLQLCGELSPRLASRLEGHDTSPRRAPAVDHGVVAQTLRQVQARRHRRGQLPVGRVPCLVTRVHRRCSRGPAAWRCTLIERDPASPPLPWASCCSSAQTEASSSAWMPRTGAIRVSMAPGVNPGALTPRAGAPPPPGPWPPAGVPVCPLSRVATACAALLCRRQAVTPRDASGVGTASPREIVMAVPGPVGGLLPLAAGLAAPRPTLPSSGASPAIPA